MLEIFFIHPFCALPSRRAHVILELFYYNIIHTVQSPANGVQL